MQKMGREKFDINDISELGNWNIAVGYTMLLMELVRQTKDFNDIAVFGTNDLVSEFVMDEETKDKARFKAIRRLTHTYLEITQKSLYLLLSKLKPKMRKFREDLKHIWKILPLLEVKTWREKKQKTKINEEAFEKILGHLQEMGMEIFDMMNQSRLIFGSGEEIDPAKWKEVIKEKLTTQA